MLQFCREHRRLDAVHPAVTPDEGVPILGRLTMIGDEARTIGRVRVIGDDRSGITVCPEILAWIKTKGRNIAECAGPSSFIVGAVRLRTIFDHF